MKVTPPLNYPALGFSTLVAATLLFLVLHIYDTHLRERSQEQTRHALALVDQSTAVAESFRTLYSNEVAKARPPCLTVLLERSGFSNFCIFAELNRERYLVLLKGNTNSVLRGKVRGGPSFDEMWDDSHLPNL